MNVWCAVLAILLDTTHSKIKTVKSVSLRARLLSISRLFKKLPVCSQTIATVALHICYCPRKDLPEAFAFIARGYGTNYMTQLLRLRFTVNQRKIPTVNIGTCSVSNIGTSIDYAYSADVYQYHY